MSLFRRLRVPVQTATQSLTFSTTRSIQPTARFFTTQSDKQESNHTSNQSNKSSEKNSTEQSTQPDSTANQSDNNAQPEPEVRRYAFVAPGHPSAFERIDKSGNQPSDQAAGQTKEEWLNERDRQNAILAGTYIPPTVNHSVNSCPNPFYDESADYAPFLDRINFKAQSLEEITQLSNQSTNESSTDHITSPFPRDLPPIYTVGVIDHQHRLPDPSERSPLQRSIKAFTYFAIAVTTVYVILILDINDENANDQNDHPRALNRAQASGGPHVFTSLREWTHKHIGIGSVSKQPSSNQSINEPAVARTV